ncbi:MAG: aminoglycoside phosphotransferase family protein [Oscillospiraceae bacterium]|nr:aminoglycoside phosphotransferase family protein [Oscillospiraceae bacterium]
MFESVVKNFDFNGDLIANEPYGGGHINSTFLLTFKSKSGNIRRYILQKINTSVFPDPDSLMNNICKVTDFLRKKIKLAGGDVKRETLKFIPCNTGKYYFIDDNGDCWRAYCFVEDTSTYQAVENPIHFYNAGKSFGQFQNKLSDFPAKELVETIKDFHDTGVRYDNFIKAVEKDPLGRAKDVQKEIDFVLERKKEATKIVDLLKLGDIPYRVTHNDTKFNNILIDNETGEGICVIDLDTVMPGCALYDYGDAIRFGASSAAEDETDLDKVYMNMELFEQFTKGFLEATKDVLTPAELENMAFSAKLMTLECGSRFLADHILGDVYFKIHHEGHNLERARTQLKLVADMEFKMDKMNEIVKKYSR